MASARGSQVSGSIPMWSLTAILPTPGRLDHPRGPYHLRRPLVHLHHQPPPVAILVKRAVSIAKGSGEPNTVKVGKITMKQTEEIAKIKMPDLNSFDLESAMERVKGACRSLGVDVIQYSHSHPNSSVPDRLVAQ
jgi:hypothetical protein